MSSSKRACFLCHLGHTRTKSKGLFYHTYKQSNGMDYDNYTELCQIQTPSGRELIRANTLQKLDEELSVAKTRVSELKAVIKRTKAGV